MWSGGEELNEDDKPVRIYQPILYGGSRKPNADDATCSCVGGAPVSDWHCPSCRDPLFLLAQLHTASLNRTLQVWACNRLSCLHSLFEDTGNAMGRNVLSYGGGNGVVMCRRVPTGVPPNASVNVVPPIPRSVVQKGINEWSMSDTTAQTPDGDMDDLESKLAAMETKQESIPIKTTTRDTSSRKATPSAPEAILSSGFPIFELHSLPEPRVVRCAQPYDDDDVGMASGRGIDDRKIQQMLAQYMAMEDDEEILAALRDTSGGGGGYGGGSASGKRGERDERLSASDRALLTFTDRMKLAPRQVVRYALGGVPLWSIPTIPNQTNSECTETRTNKKESHHQQQRGNSKLFGQEQPIPPCSSCGTPRLFEMQLVPSLLHLLEVDHHATTTVTKTNTNKMTALATAYENGGMDWGNIAIYTCPNLACQRQAGEEYCVVQDSVDERPSGPQRVMDQGDAHIQEDAHFEDDEEEDECEGIIEDGEDDGSVW